LEKASCWLPSRIWSEGVEQKFGGVAASVVAGGASALPGGEKAGPRRGCGLRSFTPAARRGPELWCAFSGDPTASPTRSPTCVHSAFYLTLGFRAFGGRGARGLGGRGDSSRPLLFLRAPPGEILAFVPCSQVSALYSLHFLYLISQLFGKLSPKTNFVKSPALARRADARGACRAVVWRRGCAAVVGANGPRPVRRLADHPLL